MKKKILFLLLAVVFICTTVALSGPPGAVKNSPLFKTSLKQSIDRMEGKVVYDNNGELATSSGKICPNLPSTQASTCSPSYCGNPETCQSTCTNTCGGTCWSTCYNTCNNTCNYTCWSTCSSTCASTCSYTCYPGNCQRYDFEGQVWWFYSYVKDYDWTDLPEGMTQVGTGEVKVKLSGESDYTKICDFNSSSGEYSGYRICQYYASAANVFAVSTIRYYDGHTKDCYNSVDITNPYVHPTPNITEIDVNIWP